MPNQSMHGSAFEYALCITLEECGLNWIKKNQTGDIHLTINENDRFHSIQTSFESIPSSLKTQMLQASKAGWNKILDMEPRIVYTSREDPVIIHVNENEGRAGDVRDILFIRHLSNSRRRKQIQSILAKQSENWEIGISSKWNHDALKHSRLSNNIDFGKSWFNHNCTKSYWSDIAKPFSYLISNRGKRWQDLPDKVNLIYYPIMEAFKDELNRLSKNFPDVPRRLVEYLVGRYDFYKVIGNVSNRYTQVQPFNLYGKLNQDNEGIAALAKVPSEINNFPDRITNICWKTDSSTTIEVVLNKGWQFDIRVHNADRIINPSVKLDIRFAGSPFPIWPENW